MCERLDRWPVGGACTNSRMRAQHAYLSMPLTILLPLAPVPGEKKPMSRIMGERVFAALVRSTSGPTSMAGGRGSGGSISHLLLGATGRTNKTKCRNPPHNAVEVCYRARQKDAAMCEDFITTLERSARPPAHAPGFMNAGG